MGSVRDWADQQGFEYRWLGDELFTVVPERLLEKTRRQLVVATDLARLIVLEGALAEGYQQVIWADADVFVIEPGRFELPQAEALFGREVWIARDAAGALKVYRKIHNAFMAFSAGNSVLPFYRFSAERILNRYDPAASRMVAQLIGPKLLTLLHNAIGFDVLESAGVLCPLVARDLLDGGGRALDRFTTVSQVPPMALNLCGSSVRGGEIGDAEMDRLISELEVAPLSERA